MQCEKFETLWNQALDERRVPEDDSALHAHAAECRRCAEILGLSDTLFNVLDARPNVEPSADFADRVLAEVNRPTRHFTSPAVMFAVLAIAAAIAVMVGLRWQFVPPANPAGSEVKPEIARIHPEPAEINVWQRGPRTPVETPLAPMLDSLPGLNEEYLAVLRHTGTAVALFPGHIRRATLSEEPGGVADRIRPVAQPMTAAFDALRRALPGSASDMPELPGMPDDAKSSSYPHALPSTNDVRLWS